MEFFILSIIILFLGAIFSIFTKEKFKLKLCTIFTFIAAATVLVPAFGVLFKGQELSTILNFSQLFGDIVVVE